MAELEERFHGVDLVPTPDQWDTIERRARAPIAGQPGSRVAATVVGVLVAAAAIAIVVLLLGHLQHRSPAVESRLKPNGDIVVSQALCGTGPGGRCVFQLVRVDPVTGATRPLLDIPGPPLSVGNAVFSPDGSMVAFTGARVEIGVPVNRRAIYVMHTDGTGLKRIAFCQRGTTPNSFCDPSDLSWSPDDSHLAWVLNPNDYSTAAQLQSVNVSTGEVTELCSSRRCGNQIGEPDWSPDGSKIAFSNEGHISEIGPVRLESSIWVMNADGTGLQRLTPGITSCHSDGFPPHPTACLFDTDPTWSPDGAQIAFGRYSSSLPTQIGLNAPRSELMTVDPNGGNLRTLATCEATDCSAHLMPSWSPDGRSIAFMLRDTAAIDIYRFGSAAPALAEIRTCGAVKCRTPSGFGWSPDARSLAVDVSDGLYVAGVDGHRFTLVTPHVYSFVAWLPAPDSGS